MAKISTEYNLKVLYPDIAKQWDVKKNHPLKPEDFTPKSHKKIWWVCKKKQHSYDARIDSRTRGSGCRKCYLEGRK
jgi:hypothetical protein